jgi:ornithine carbamoyltransferase
MNIKIVTPKPYYPDSFYVKEAKKFGINVEITDEIEDSTKDADVIATDTWVSMGDETEKEKRIKEFKRYTVNKELMKLAKSDAIFLHCLPAYYNHEVTKEVAHGKQSVIFDEAENRLWAQIGIMVTLNKQ